MKMQPPVKRDFAAIQHHNANIIMQPQIQTVAQLPIESKKVGHPDEFTEKDVAQLIAGFQNGLNTSQCIIYAGVIRSTYYRKYNRDQEFRDKMEVAKNQFVLKAATRVNSVIVNGSDRDAAPIAWKVFEKRMRDLYGNDDKINQSQQNNFFILDHDTLAKLTQRESATQNSAPTELLETLEAESELDTGTEEGSPAPIY